MEKDNNKSVGDWTKMKLPLSGYQGIMSENRVAARITLFLSPSPSAAAAAAMLLLLLWRYRSE